MISAFTLVPLTRATASAIFSAGEVRQTFRVSLVHPPRGSPRHTNETSVMFDQLQ